MEAVSPIRKRTEAEERRMMRLRANRTKPVADMTQSNTARGLVDIGEELGISRERVRQLEAHALRKLLSPHHRNFVIGLLDDAIVEWKRAKASGNAKRMLWAIHNVDVYTDALAWLEDARNGTLEAHLRDVQQRQDEPTVYVATVHYTDALMPQPAAKWTSYALTAPRRK